MVPGLQSVHPSGMCLALLLGVQGVLPMHSRAVLGLGSSVCQEGLGWERLRGTGELAHGGESWGCSQPVLC